MEQKGNSAVVNRAKKWQIALFPFNNAATNVYFAFYSYFTYFALMYLTGSVGTSLAGTVVSAGLAIAVSTFTSLFTPLMRVFDGVTDPICGSLMDKAKTKIGKFRPFMIVGNILLALSVLCMMIFFRNIPDNLSWLRWVIYILSYIIYVLGYTAQCACTKAGQTCLTNDPKQRSQFVIWNMVGTIGSIVLVNILASGILTNEALCAKGLIINPILDGVLGEGVYSYEGLLNEFRVNGEINPAYKDLLESLDPNLLYSYNLGAGYGSQFYDIMVPIVIGVSAIYTAMAIAAISEKDKPEFWGVPSDEPVKFKDYLNILKDNKEIRWLVISAGLNKLASTVATSGAVAFMLYGCLMGDYNGLFIPFYAVCFIFMGIFFIWGSKTAGQKGQKRGVTQFTIFAFIFYIGVLALLCIYDHDNPNTWLSLFTTDGGFKITINLYTILFIIFYGCGYGAFNCCDQLTIPMVADCTDYETYRSGKYVPGIMGTVFSLVDKIISSLQFLLLQVFIVYLVPNLTSLPAEKTPYMEGMKLSTIICFCILPMVSWLVTTFCMSRYSLSGKKLQEVQAVNAVRKAAVKGGMSMEEAMEKWQTIDQVPLPFIHQVKENKKENILDKIYNKLFTKTENVTKNPHGSNVVDIPEEYITDETRNILGLNKKEGE